MNTDLFTDLADRKLRIQQQPSGFLQPELDQVFVQAEPRVLQEQAIQIVFVKTGQFPSWLLVISSL